MLKRTQAAREREALGDRKNCSRCERLGRDHILPKSDFAQNSYTVDGLQHWCMRCTNEDIAEKRRERRTCYLITRIGNNPSEQPVTGAWKALYPTANGERVQGWFLRFPKAGDLEAFLERHAPARVQPASTNPAFKEILIQEKANG